MQIEYRNLEKLGYTSFPIQEQAKNDEVIKEFFDTAEFLRLSKSEQFLYLQELKTGLDVSLRC